MRAQIAQRLRSRSRGNSLSAVPPPKSSGLYLSELHACAARILYRSPIPSRDGVPIYILNGAAFPDAYDVDYDSLLPYVLERLPGEDELLNGRSYEIVFFAGGNADGATSTKKNRPSWSWFIQAYNVLSRAMRKRIQRLYVVHERSWVRILVEMFSTIASLKFRKKIVHVSTLTSLALEMDIQDLLIPPSAYLYDRQMSPDIHVPYESGRRAFGAKRALPRNADGKSRLPRVLRETSLFIINKDNITTEGLFRIPAHAKLKDIVREAYDRGQKFIVWKEMKVTLAVPAYPRAESTNAILSELDPMDAYGVHQAAGVLKLWYSELREPLFPTSSYAVIRSKIDRQEEDIDMERLQALLSPMSDSSPLPAQSRQILIRHLLPLLSEVAASNDQNKMTANNLALCFAPGLLCGEDPMEDMKMSSLVAIVLTSAIEQWDRGLREACGAEEKDFWEDLMPPQRLADCEDPPETSRILLPGSAADLASRQLATGMALTDNETRMVEAPPLPPRPPAQQKSDVLTGWTETQTPKRKPTPSTLRPRYSVIMAQDMAESPSDYDTNGAAITDGCASQATLPSAQENEKCASASGGEQPPLQINAPKRKALTNDSSSEKQPEPDTPPKRSMSDSRAAISGIIAGQAAELIRRKPVTKSTDGSSRNPSASFDHESQKKPAWAASSRPVTINALARGVSPSGSGAPPPQDTSRTTATYAPKAPKPSPGLLERMPSFESSRSSSSSLKSGRELKVPGKLNMKKPSVEDLRKLYEERTDTVKTLVRAGSADSRRSLTSMKSQTAAEGAA